ncbi:uncharacterized protein LOC113228625 [Hyposmocoma kahamanoa]|uniref:uncharacterized protein LOC113228625 n=1 Tax=Hyposmocoma kahamanoa TaxID=1477025 RepID=UPI000E6D9F31|nr:uncharacterized protein LOC113228625 [Hyposmocoma kahamanoa]
MQGHRSEIRQSAVSDCEESLTNPSAGHKTIEAILPVLNKWLERRHGTLTFRLTQVLSGHGCFGKYLCRIAGGEPTAKCHHCMCLEDTPRHTVEECPAWAEPRHDLVAAVGSDLSLPSLVRAMVGSDRLWEAVVSFCETV